MYRVAKDTAAAPPAAQPAAMPPDHPEVSGSGPDLQWKLPSGWEEVPPGQMRLASFRVAGTNGEPADVSIVPLPGMAGGDVNNVNRWRGQIGLPPVPPEDLDKLAQPVEIAGQPGQLYDQSGTVAASGDKTRILAAILRREGTAWFFKMMGDDGLVAQQKPNFIEFLKSLRFTAAAQPQLPPSHPPIGGADSAPSASAAGSAEGKPNWKVPANWQEVPGGQFLMAKFAISGADNAQAAVNVSMSAGEGGGMLANVNRWRGQLGLAPCSEPDFQQQAQSLEVAGGKATVIGMAGTDGRTGQKASLIGAIVSQPNRTWFYKLMGNEQVVADEKAAFTKFVQSAKYAP